MSLVATYFLIELVPIYLVIDPSFITFFQNQDSSEIQHSLTQPFFE